jgi:hypothetical protein
LSARLAKENVAIGVRVKRGIEINKIRRSRREILSDPKAISDYRQNKAGSFWANIQRFLDFARNDNSGLN